ncbi:MAG: hypothetical protein KGM47_11300 [Acidobacteriota bacterium]|nr:hypothetical protein [Acidobacteriota bacterium]
MKDETKESIVITIAITLGVVAVIAVATVLALHGITISFKAFNLGFSAVMVFGILGYFYKIDLRRSRRAAVTFGAMIVAHVLVYLYLFRHGIGVSSAAIGFTGIPEIGVAGIILIVVGGAKYGYLKGPAGSHGEHPSGRGPSSSGAGSHGQCSPDRGLSSSSETTHGKSKPG